MASTGAIGIDLGSQRYKVAIVRSGGVDILTNDLANRSTPVVVSFGEKQRYIGEHGYSRLNTNFRNTISFPSRFLGLKPDYSDMHSESKWLTNRLVTNDEGNLAHQVRFLGEDRQFTPEQIMAMVLTGLSDTLKNNGISLSTSDVVMSVPVYFTETERRAMLDAAKIAGIPCLRLMNDNTAAALSYGLFRRKDFTEKPRIVAFADMGHSKFTCTIAQFTQEKLQVLAHAAERNLGGRDFDWVLMEFLSAEFEKKYGCNPLESPRPRLKLAVAVEKLRKVLSANKDSQISVEFLMEDCDLNRLVTRDEFETLCGGLLEKVEATCVKALKIAGVEGVDNVEIVGGSSRIPCVQDILCRVFKQETVSKTLNAEEAVVRGLAVQSAVLSPLYKVKEFFVNDIIYHPISISLSPLEMEVESEPEVLFAHRNNYPVTKIMKVKKKSPFKIDLFYTEEIAQGLEKDIAKFAVLGPSEEEDYTVKLHIKMSGHGVVNLENAEKLETVMEEVELKEGEEQPEEEKKYKKKIKKTPLEISSELKGMNQQKTEAFAQEERKMHDEDRIARETHEIKNALEAFVYESRSKIRYELVDYTVPEDQAKILDQLQETENWLYGEGEDTLKSVYNEKLENLKSLVEPVKRRHQQYTMYPELVREIENTLVWAEGLANSTDAQYEHIPQEDRQPILQKAQECRDWVTKSISAIESLNRTQEPTVPTDDFVKLNIQMREFTEQIMNKPKPAPPKEEKPQEKPQEQPQESQEKAQENPNEENGTPEQMELD